MRRLLLVMAIGAALVGAPSHVSAASNDLLGAQVSPTTGTTATTFTFTVRYSGRFAPTLVAANAGPVTVTLARIAGTELDGTWRGSSRLPAGTWAVIFTASVLQGSTPSLAGPTLTVVAETAPATAAPSAWSAPSSTGGSSIDSGVPGSGAGSSSPPGVAPVASSGATPSVPAAPAASAPTQSPGTPPAGAGGGAGTPASSVPTSGTPGGTSGTPSTPSPGGPAPSGDGPRAAPAAPAESPAPSAVGLSDPGGGADDVGGPALVGLGGLALVAVLGSGLLVLAGRRRRATTADGPVDGEATATGAAAALVDRRALRRARMRLDEDPIVAAMGLADDESVAERRVRRTAGKSRPR